jgi:hypothetical protein
MSKHVIGLAKRNIKAGERLEFTIRDDGFFDSSDIRFRANIAIVDTGMLHDGTITEMRAEGLAHV